MALERIGMLENMVLAWFFMFASSGHHHLRYWHHRPLLLEGATRTIGGTVLLCSLDASILWRSAHYWVMKECLALPKRGSSERTFAPGSITRCLKAFLFNSGKDTIFTRAPIYALLSLFPMIIPTLALETLYERFCAHNWNKLRNRSQTYWNNDIENKLKRWKFGKIRTSDIELKRKRYNLYSNNQQLHTNMTI